MKLYNLPKETKIYADEISDGSAFIILHHLDGMYSYCTTERGGVIHLSGNIPIIVGEDGLYHLYQSDD